MRARVSEAQAEIARLRGALDNRDTRIMVLENSERRLKETLAFMDAEVAALAKALNAQGAAQPVAQEPVAWLPTATVKWLMEYDGPACATKTAAHNRPLKSDGGVPVYLHPTATAPVMVMTEADKAEDEAYQIGYRDGYEEAVAVIDRSTGGDGEYYASTIPGEGCPDPTSMISNIVERFTTSTPAPVEAGLIEALRSGEQADMDGCRVKVSREACEKAADILAAILSRTGGAS